MAVDSLANLKAAIVTWSKRDDLTNELDTIIDFAEARINASLRIRENEERATATADTSSRFIALPTGFLEMRRMAVISGSQYYQLNYVTPDSMQVRAEAGKPVEFSVTSQIQFDRVPDSAYTLEMNYYRELTPLTTSNTTNDILTKYPNLYLYGALAEAHKFGRDWEEATRWDAAFEREMREAKRTDRRGRVGPGARMRAIGSTP